MELDDTNTVRSDYFYSKPGNSAIWKVIKNLLCAWKLREVSK